MNSFPAGTTKTAKTAKKSKAGAGDRQTVEITSVEPLIDPAENVPIVNIPAGLLTALIEVGKRSDPMGVFLRPALQPIEAQFNAWKADKAKKFAAEAKAEKGLQGKK